VVEQERESDSPCRVLKSRLYSNI